MGSHFLLWGIFPIQGSNPALQPDALISEPPGKPQYMLLMIPLNVHVNYHVDQTAGIVILARLVSE